MKDVERCDEAIGTNGYLTRYFERWVTREIPSEWDDKWLTAEAHANLLQTFDLCVVPGLLQTPEYARAVLQFNRHSPIDIEERVRRRMERQAILTDENPPMCVFVIDENAIRRTIGDKKVMVGQLIRLRELATHPNIVIKIVALGTEHYPGCPFMSARLDGVEIVNVDDALGGRVIEGNNEVVAITRIWGEIREAALSPKGSAELIERPMEEWTE